MSHYEYFYRTGQMRTAKIDEPDDFIVDFVSRLEEEKSTAVLDVGCGAGRNAVFLAREGFHVIGSDVSPTALKTSSQRADDDDLRNCMFVVSSFLKLPFPDSRFNAAFSSYGLENVSLPEIKMALGEMKRVVRNGGLILSTLHSTEHWRFGRGKRIGPHTFMTINMIEGKEFRFITHFFEEEDVEKLFRNLSLEILSIKETVKTTDKKRAHWIIVSKK